MVRKQPTDEEKANMVERIQLIVDKYWDREIELVEDAKQRVWNVVMDCYAKKPKRLTGYQQTLTMITENG